MLLTDIAPLDAWMELENEIHRRFAVDANVFDPKGFRITPQKHWVNRLCPAVKETDKGQSFICAPAHMNIAAMARKARAPVVEECDAGMLKLVVPIYRGEEFLGAVAACGVRFEESEIDSFLVHKMTGIDAETVETLAADVPAIPRARADELSRFIRERLDVLLSAGRSG
jgi:ligand-binding sensor protein